MPAWTSDELDTIGTAEELNLASVRRDGTLRRPMTMWVVRDDDDLSVPPSTAAARPGSAAPDRQADVPVLSVC
jgi:hypothetical protein